MEVIVVTIGMVVFSFALREEKDEPNPCNIRLAQAAKRLIEQEPDDVVVVAQWETARALRQIGVEPRIVVELREDGEYLGSKEVWEEAKSEFRKYGIVHPDTLPGGPVPPPELGIIPVANPFLHLTACKRMIRGDGYRVLDRKIDWIGFDSKSTQWWTRGPVQLILYAVMQKFAGLRGHGGKQHSSG